MDSTTLLLVALLIAALVAIAMLAALLRRRPGDMLGALLRDEQRAGRGGRTSWSGTMRGPRSAWTGTM